MGNCVIVSARSIYIVNTKMCFEAQVITMDPKLHHIHPSDAEQVTRVSAS